MVRRSEQEQSIDEESLRRRARQLMDGSYSRKDIIMVLAEETGLGRNRIYRLIQGLD